MWSKKKVWIGTINFSHNSTLCKNIEISIPSCFQKVIILGRFGFRVMYWKANVWWWNVEICKIKDYKPNWTMLSINWHTFAIYSLNLLKRTIWHLKSLFKWKYSSFERHSLGHICRDRLMVFPIRTLCLKTNFENNPEPKIKVPWRNSRTEWWTITGEFSAYHSFHDFDQIPL